jgi:polysaccharide pyruvyl transferase WcaK-like protein
VTPVTSAVASPEPAVPEPRALIIGHLCNGNFGDELMLRGLVSRLAGLGASSVVLRSRPHDWMDPRPADATYIGRLSRQRLRQLRTPILLCGGTHFHDADVEVARLRSNAAIALLSSQMVANRLAGATYHLVAIGVGPLEGRGARAITAATLRRAASITVRDTQSQEEVRRLSGREAPLVPDLGLLAPELRSTTAPPDAPYAVVAPVPDPSRPGESIPSAAEVSAVLGRTGLPVRVFPLHRSEGNLTSAQNLASRVPGARVELGTGGLASLITELAGAEVVLSARFHGLVAAAALGRPVIAAPYHPKVQTLVDEVGLAQVSEGAEAYDHAQRRAADPPLSATNTSDLDTQLRLVAACRS